MARHIPGPLYYAQLGPTGTPMMFLHSTPDDHRIWLYQTAHFSSWYRTIAVDLAGYGRSPAVQPGTTIDDQAEACWQIIDTFTPGGAIIHGNSFGSEVAMHMAQQQPHRTLALILSGCGYMTPEPFLRWAQRYRDEGIALRYEQLLDHFAVPLRDDPVLRYYARMVVELNNEGTLASIIAMNEALADRPPDSFFAQITSPTLFIIGTLDRTRPFAPDLRKRINGSQLVEVEGVGHAVNIEGPAGYDEHCIRFLSQLGLFPGPTS